MSVGVCRHGGYRDRRPQKVRSGRGLPGGKLGGMRIVAVHALLPLVRAEPPVPIAADAAVGARLPVFEGRTMTTAAQLRAVLKSHHATIAGLQLLQVVFIVAIETSGVPTVLAVPHHDVGVFLGHPQRSSRNATARTPNSTIRPCKTRVVLA